MESYKPQHSITWRGWRSNLKKFCNQLSQLGILCLGKVCLSHNEYHRHLETIIWNDHNSLVWKCRHQRRLEKSLHKGAKWEIRWENKGAMPVEWRFTAGYATLRHLNSQNATSVPAVYLQFVTCENGVNKCVDVSGSWSYLSFHPPKMRECSCWFRIFRQSWAPYKPSVRCWSKWSL